ncbi:two pore domain potassium channel family protein [candidate division KSB1 bacterium]|nr:two pore domain potassium channel family protein [candidate division KSB1 bacterium]MBL7094396.1 two pore domain potassium channel family protein [candidate division KSB1 bacterium]
MVTKKSSMLQNISFQNFAKWTRLVSAVAIFIFIICYIMGAFLHTGGSFSGYLKVGIVNAVLFLFFVLIRKIFSSKKKAKKKIKKKTSVFYKFSFPIVFVLFFIAGMVEYYIINHQNLYWIILPLLVLAVSLSVYEFWLQIKLIWHGETYHRETTLVQFLYLYATTVFSFAFLYTILDSVYGNMFHINYPSDIFFDFLYLSVITVSTLGYGDIVPTTTLAKFLIMIQTIVGYLFLYIFLGLVISWLGTKERK